MAIGTNWAEIWAPVWGPVWQGSASQVEVPDVVGQSQDSATLELETALFVVAVATAYSSTVAAGDVISQSPTAGSMASEGATVTITVSLGAAPVQDSAGGWAAYFRYEQMLEERRRWRRKREEEELEAERIEDETTREIAQLLHKQQKKDEAREDLERLRGLVDQFREIPTMSAKARDALERARVRGTLSALANLDKELKRMLEEEEMAVLMMLIND